ncbi:MAG: hypothetical protein ACTSPV_07420 [Candidatus Hodarchaeales archaeon]
MTKQYEFNPVVWVSLASTAGLSLMSIGRPGLRSDLDEQIYTGGLTAVQQMLGGEVGGDTKRFVGGSHSNKTGRFTVKQGEKELIGQFLLISPHDKTIAPVLIDFYEDLVTLFAEETLKTDLYERAEREFSAFSISDLLDIFIGCIAKARKKYSLPLDQKLFSQAFNQALVNSLNDYEYSATLVRISEEKGKFQEISKNIQSRRNELIDTLVEDLLELLVSEHPHAIIMYPKLKSLKKDVHKLLLAELKSLHVEDALDELIRDFEKNDLSSLLEDYAIYEVTKANLGSRLEDEVLHKFIREFPLLVLADPLLDGFKTKVENLTVRINEQYDLAGTLSRIGKEIFKNHPKEDRFVIPFIRNFCEQFSTGLTNSAWKYMQIVFKLSSMETSVELAEVLPKFKDEIPQSHFSTIEKMMTKYKLTKLSPVSFNVNQASDALPFYRALFSNLGLGVNMIISDVALGTDYPDNYVNWAVRRFDDFSIRMHRIYFIYSVYSYLDSIKSKFSFTLAFPDHFGTTDAFDFLDVQSFIQALIKVNQEYMTKEQKLVEKRLEDFKKAFHKKIDDLEKFLDRNALDVSKGVKLKPDEADILSFAILPAKPVQEILNELQTEYSRILDRIQPNLSNISGIAKKFLDGKITEKKYKGYSSDRSFLSKSRTDFEKYLSTAQKNIEKRYNQVTSTVPKQLTATQKEISKLFMRACSFLNINRKNLVKNKNFLPDSSDTTNAIFKNINSIMDKQTLFSWDNLGYYYFYSKNRRLPSSLTKKISSSLVGKKSLPLLKEAMERINKNPTIDIYRSYAQVLELRAKELLNSLFTGIGNMIANNYLRMSPDIKFIKEGTVLIPTIELGFLDNDLALESLRILLKEDILIDTEKVEGKTISRVLVKVPRFGCDYKDFRELWVNKDWDLKRILLLLSWRSLIKSNAFFINLIYYSAGLYSNRVKESIEDILRQIERRIIMN